MNAAANVIPFIYHQTISDRRLFDLKLARKSSKYIRENIVLELVKALSLRVKINVTGIVQGVGFRPFIYRIAVKNGLAGYVRNRGDAGVEILLEGDERRHQKFYA